MNKDLDIYFNDHYGTMYEKMEKGKAKVFNYKSTLGSAKHQFILREIPIKINNETYYDIITPYGYGGPIIEKWCEGNKDKFVSEFIKSFYLYCKENRIVSEFIRFHPLIRNVEDFKSFYDVTCIKETVGTNLKDFSDPFNMEFTKKTRSNIRRSLRKGVSYEIIEKPSNLEEFKEIYYSTMKRNNASDFYYFDDDYFNKVITHFQNNIINVKANFQNKTIAQGLFFIYNDLIHIHLSGTLSNYLHLSPAYILRYAITLWGKEKGYSIIHHGGGRTNSTEDGLYKFKKGFAKNTKYDFYIGKKIWNNDVHKKLCEITGVNSQIEYFPAYRYSRMKI
ncbi:GNAT family N-acetyltransferase [Alteribacillus sp. HJP-4]|uniref:GNAT family N-acetyltransferase n=1 Tax=Alteribacillus sp. HJP-4 TaxID=2775394 RepID=UPI0035CCEFD8